MQLIINVIALSRWIALADSNQAVHVEFHVAFSFRGMEQHIRTARHQMRHASFALIILIAVFGISVVTILFSFTKLWRDVSLAGAYRKAKMFMRLEDEKL